MIEMKDGWSHSQGSERSLNPNIQASWQRWHSMILSLPYNDLGKITIIPKPELRGFGGIPLQALLNDMFDHFWVTSAVWSL